MHKASREVIRLFRSRTGQMINADVNAAYQIMKKGNNKIQLIPKVGKVNRINVS